MPNTGNRAPDAPTDAQTAEQKMRRALGLHGNNNGPSQGNQPRTPQQRPDQARQRHRFVQDGGVPVTVVNHRADDSTALKERVTELERQLENERAQHAACRRSLQEAQATAQAIETRLVHAGLAHTEALNQERRTLLVAQQRLNEAQALLHAPRRNRPAPEPQAIARQPQAIASQPQAIARQPQATANESQAAAPETADIAAASATPEASSKPAQKSAPLAADAPVPKKRGRPRTRPLPEPKPVRWWTPSFRAKTKA